MSASRSEGDRGRERLDELLADRAVQALTPEEARELESLLASSPGVDADELDRAAAAVDLASSGAKLERLPASLRQRVLESAPAHLVARKQSEPLKPGAPTRTPRTDVLRWSGWLAAAAAAVVAIVAWMPRTVQKLSPAQAWQEFAASAPDEIVWSWKPTDDPAGKSVHGQLMWSPSRQKGYIKLSGLPQNDPTVAQYQLWLFCTTRDDRYPVDGGVFDISSSGEAIVPITAHLSIEVLKMAAVTMERPGGVVVSARERLLALATL